MVKRYVREAGSDLVETLLASGPAAISRLSEVEVASALARRMRTGDCSVEERDVALATLAKDMDSFLIVELVPAVTRRAALLLNAYSLRAADAVQLGSFLHLQEKLGQDIPFVVFDARLAAVASESGATVHGARLGGSSPQRIR